MSKANELFSESISLLREMSAEFDGIDDRLCDDYRHALAVLIMAGRANVRKAGEGNQTYYGLDAEADHNLRKAIYGARISKKAEEKQ